MKKSKEYYDHALKMLRNCDPSEGMFELARDHVLAGDKAELKERAEAAESFRGYVKQNGGW